MTAAEALERMATHPEDRKPDPIETAFYRRRPAFEGAGQFVQFVYDYDRTERR